MTPDATTADTLVAWAEPNTVVFNDPAVEQHLLAALDGPVPDDLADPRTNPDVPLLRFADGHPAAPLLEAVALGATHHAARCDRCDVRLRGIRNYRLWVPMGCSVVQYQACYFCHDVLSDCYNDLVWT